MKQRLLITFSILLVFAGLAMLIAPRVSNQVGKQIAHSTIEDFKSLKSEATADEPADRKESTYNESGNDPQKDNITAVQSDNEPVILDKSDSQNLVTTPDFDRLYIDSVVYNEALQVLFCF